MDTAAVRKSIDLVLTVLDSLENHIAIEGDNQSSKQAGKHSDNCTESSSVEGEPELVDVLDKMLARKSSRFDLFESKVKQQEAMKKKRREVVQRYAQMVKTQIYSIVDQIGKGEFVAYTQRSTSRITPEAVSADVLQSLVRRHVVSMEESSDDEEPLGKKKKRRPQKVFVEMHRDLLSAHEVGLVLSRLKEHPLLETLKEDYTVKLLYSLFHHFDEASRSKEQLQQKCDNLMATMDQMRIGYLRELNNYEEKTRSLTLQLPQEKTSVKVDAYYFDASEDLEMSPEIEEILNKKISRLTEDFTAKISLLEKHNEKNFETIKKYQLMTDGQEGFNIEKLNAHDMIRKLFIVDKNPSSIWKAFQELEPGFFHGVIKREYDIDREYGRRFERHFRDELYELKQIERKRLEEIERDCRKQLNLLTNQNSALESQIRELQAKSAAQFELFRYKVLDTLSAQNKAKILKLTEEKNQELEAMKEKPKSTKWEPDQEQLFRIAIDKRQRLLGGLISQIEGMAKKFQTEMPSNFLEDLKTFKFLCTRIDKEYLESELKVANQAISDLKQKTREMEKRTISAEFEWQIEACFRSKYQHMFSDLELRHSEFVKQSQVAQQSLSVEIMKQQLTKAEYVQRATSEQYIELLEQKVHRLNEFIESQRVHNQVLMDFELNPIPRIREMRAQFLEESSEKVTATHRNILMPMSRDVICQTDVRNIEKEIFQKYKYKQQEAIKRPFADVGTQRGGAVISSEAQTEFQAKGEPREQETMTKLDMQKIAGFEQLAQEAIKLRIQRALQDKFTKNKKEAQSPAKLVKKRTSRLELVGKQVSNSLQRSSTVLPGTEGLDERKIPTIEAEDADDFSVIDEKASNSLSRSSSEDKSYRFGSIYSKILSKQSKVELKKNPSVVEKKKKYGKQGSQNIVRQNSQNSQHIVRIRTKSLKQQRKKAVQNDETLERCDTQQTHKFEGTSKFGMIDSADVSPLINIEETKSREKESSSTDSDEVISAPSPTRTRKSGLKHKKIVISKHSEENLKPDEEEPEEEGPVVHHSPIIPKSRTRKMRREGRSLTRLSHMGPGLPMKIPAHRKMFQVQPYGLSSLENLLNKRLQKSQKRSKGVQTEESSLQVRREEDRAPRVSIPLSQSASQKSLQHKDSKSVGTGINIQVQVAQVQTEQSAAKRMSLPQQMYCDPNITQHSMDTPGDKEGFQSKYYNSHGKHHSLAENQLPIISSRDSLKEEDLLNSAKPLSSHKNSRNPRLQGGYKKVRATEFHLQQPKFHFQSSTDFPNERMAGGQQQTIQQIQSNFSSYKNPNHFPSTKSKGLLKLSAKRDKLQDFINTNQQSFLQVSQSKMDTRKKSGEYSDFQLIKRAGPSSSMSASKQTQMSSERVKKDNFMHVASEKALVHKPAIMSRQRKKQVIEVHPRSRAKLQKQDTKERILADRDEDYHLLDSGAKDSMNLDDLLGIN